MSGCIVLLYFIAVTDVCIHAATGILIPGFMCAADAGGPEVENTVHKGNKDGE